jgi:hypothetical protein
MPLAVINSAPNLVRLKGIDMALVQVEVPYKKGYDFGVGVDLASGSPMGKVVGSAFSGVESALGATTKFEITRIHSTSELETKLGINVEASYGCGAFGGVSARFDYAKSSKIQTSSLFMAITSNVELAFNSIDEPTLNSEATQLFSRPDAFSSRYGNMFVRGVGRGGLFVGVIQIDTSSSEDSESISAELEGSYGLFSASAKTKFDEIQKKHRSEVRISVYHEGGPIDLSMKDLTDPSQLYEMLQQWLKSFQDHPEQNAKPYYVTLAPIAIANGPIPPNAADIQHAQDILVICAKQRSTILDGLNLMDHIIQNPARYEFVEPTTQGDIVKAFVGYQADFDLVAAAASQAMNDVTKAVTPAEFARQIGKPYPQGVPPTPMPTLEKGLIGVYAGKGEAIANADPLVAALRNREPDGPSRRGFDIGMGVCEGHTLWGPGKQKILDSLPPAEQVGFNSAAAFSLQRNNNPVFATKGAIIVKADPTLAAARAIEPPGLSWLGFDIATGIFGDPALGAQGNTQMGPGSEKIRSTLNLDGQRGFNAAVALHLSRKYR